MVEAVRGTMDKPVDEKELPVDLKRILHRKNITVFLADFEYSNVFGILVNKGKENYFYVDQRAEKKLKHFILAHLLGHYHLHLSETCRRIYCQYKFASDTMPQKEEEADQYACRLLMPERSVKRLIAQKCSLQEMAERFEVPVENVNARLSGLGLHVARGGRTGD